MSSKTKMVCVMRKDLRNTDGHKVPKGKLIAQGGHAYVGAIMKLQREKPNLGLLVLEDWLSDSFVKIALGADSEEELMTIYHEAIEKGLNAVLITDIGNTEFGKPTVTCIGIGPDYSENIDAVTGHLKGFN